MWNTFKRKYQILAQLSAPTCLFRIFVCRCQDAHVERGVSLLLPAPDRTILEDAQQFRLSRRRHLANFVKQQRSTVGKFKATDAPPPRR